MKCGNCKTQFEGRNFGFMAGGSVVDICSTSCRAGYRRKAETGRQDPATPKKALGSRAERKLSPSEVKRRMRPKEGDISKAIAAELEAAGIWNTRTQSGAIKTASGHVMRLCRQGTPDRIATPGLHVWIEVKRSGEKPTDEQLLTLNELRSNGALAFVIDDAEDLSVILRCLTARIPTVAGIVNQIREVQREVDLAIARDRETRR